MGVLTDFFIANDHELSKLEDDAAAPFEVFDTFQAKGVDTIMIDTLYSILLDCSEEDAVSIAPLVHSGGEEGPWTFRLPRELVSTLATLDAGRVDMTCERWIRNEQFDGWELDDVRYVLNGLIAVAARATAQQAGLFHWVCL